MAIRKKIWLIFSGIIILAVLAGIVDFPSGPDIRIGNYFKELKVHLGLDLQGGAHLLYTADTSGVETTEAGSALDGVRDVIERRVNAIGVSEPIVQTSKVGEEWRLIVQLPGVSDINQAINTIGETPFLEFREEAAPEELTEDQITEAKAYNLLAKGRADEVLTQTLVEGSDFSQLAIDNSEGPSGPQGGELGFFSRGQMVLEFEDAVFNAELGKVIPEVVQTEFGYHIIKVNEEQTGEDGLVQRSAQHILINTQPEDVVPSQGFTPTELSGKQLKTARVQFDPNTNEPEVSLEFDDEGRELFGLITERNVGKLVAIYLDGAPISIPRVNEAIKEGKAVITGSFTLDEAKTLARRLNAGALPVPITLINQQNIGPTLGRESIERSFFAGLIGLILVALFMIFYYRFPGVLACFALLIYALVALALFKLIPVTLTLAGVAGFILSIGMAVDANVLIFERIREELRTGKSLKSSVEDGFKRAWLSIRDSNMSSIITCIILAWFGTSLIKGFAITLGIGILISMFSAIIVTRNFLRLSAGDWLEKRIGWMGVRKVSKEE
ncbi:MAG: protein translocase subunit SecD [Patescibacteria group bacterium]